MDFRFHLNRSQLVNKTAPILLCLGYMLRQHPNGVDYGDCRIALHRSYLKIMPLGNLSYLGGKTFMQILSLIEKEEGPTLVTLCNNQNFYFLL
jgi:hypothetical protein